MTFMRGANQVFNRSMLEQLIRILWVSPLVSLLVACSTYHPKQLPRAVNFSVPTAAVNVSSSFFPSQNRKPYRIEIKQGLTMIEVAMLAVINNPLLKVARDEAHIASAQSFSAGLLPDPQVNFDRLFPITSGNKGFDVGLNYPFSVFLTYKLQKKAALAEEQQTNLNVLWQEWQVISQAQTLFTQIISAESQLKVLKQYEPIVTLAYKNISAGLDEKNVTLEEAGNQLTSLQSVLQQIDTLKQQLSQHKAALNQLLNFPPDTKLQLNGEIDHVPVFNFKEIKQALHDLGQSRPDLLALKAGYQSQDLKYRQAIINQFPALNIGFTRSTDTTDTKYYGFGISLNLPIFNANRGNVAIEKATRQKLYDDYQQRLNAAYSEVYQILAQQKLSLTQYKKEKKQAEVLCTLARSAQKAYEDHDMTVVNYSAVVLNVINAKLSLLSLGELMTEHKIALKTLLGPLGKAAAIKHYIGRNP